MPEEQIYTLAFSNPSFASNMDALDQDDESLTRLENLEENAKINQISIRRGISFFSETPSLLHDSGIPAECYGFAFQSFDVPKDGEEDIIGKKQYHIALFKDESLPAGANVNSEYHRSRFCFVESDSPPQSSGEWRELFTHYAIPVSGIENWYMTKRGNVNTLSGWAVQGWPINGLASASQAIGRSYFSNGSDLFGNHIQMSLGSESNRQHPHILQFINAPTTVPVTGFNVWSRNKGFFADNLGYQGWYISKSAPTIQELGNFLQINAFSDLVAAGALESISFAVPPGEYTYYLTAILDGVNETEVIASSSTTVKSVDENSWYVLPGFRVKTIDGVTNNSNIPTGQAANEMEVGAWDAFPKRVTHIRVYRSFKKGYWEHFAPTNNPNEIFADFNDHAPRLIATIPVIGSSQNLYGEYDSTAPRLSTFTPNPNLAIKITGQFTVINAISGKLELNSIDNERLAANAIQYMTIFYDTEKQTFPTEDTVVNENSQITSFANGRAFVSAIPTGAVAGDVFNVRIGLHWHNVGAPSTYYQVNYTDGIFEWAAGETTFIGESADRRPNYRNQITLATGQRFVWDYWENVLQSGGLYKTFKRRLRWTIRREDFALGSPYPTVFFDGLYEFPGDEENDPIVSLIPIVVNYQNESLPTQVLVCFKNSSRLLTITNGVVTIQPTTWNYGLAGPNAQFLDGNTVYGLATNGLIWKFTLDGGFVQIGVGIQDQISSLSAVELERASMTLSRHENGFNYLSVEFTKYDDTSSGYPGDEPSIFPVDSACLESYVNQFADRDAFGYCWSFMDDAFWENPAALNVNQSVDAAENFGIRYNIPRELFSKRSSVSPTHPDYTENPNIENYQFTYGAQRTPVQPVWAGKYQYITGAAAIEAVPGFMYDVETTRRYDQMNSSGNNTEKRPFVGALTTKNISQGGLPIFKHLKRIIIVSDSSGTLVLTITDVIRSITKSITHALASGITRLFVNFPHQIMNITIKYTTAYNQASSFSIKTLQLISKQIRNIL